MKNKKVLFAIVIALVAAFFIFDLGRFLSLDYLKSQQAALADLYSNKPLMVIASFFAIYVAATALSLPGAAILTLAAGAIFGLFAGTLIVSFASSIGATLAFLVSRFLLRDSIESKFGDKLRTFNDNIEKDGAFYLFTVRLVPVFPFFLVNLVMGLTKLKTGVFYLVIFVNAGTQLAKIESLSGIVSPKIIFSFALLGIFPLIAKKVVDIVKARKVYADIGAGAGGLVSSYIGSAVKARVTLIERHKMGGDCLNFGCVPSKALIRSAKLMDSINHSAQYGVETASGEIDFAKTMGRVHEVIKKIEPHDSIERYNNLGVDVVKGEATITSPWTVEVNGTTLTTRNIIVATGARPFVPPIPGLDKVDYLTSDNLWNITSLPKRLAVLGGGPIGSELTQAFARLGSEVWQIEMVDRIMNREDPEISEMKQLVCERDGEQIRIAFDEIIIAVGRSARSKGFGLEELDISTRRNGTIEVNEFLQTRFPNIYAVGDVAGPYQFTHVAAHQAWYASVNSLFGTFKKFRADYRVIPWATRSWHGESINRTWQGQDSWCHYCWCQCRRTYRRVCAGNETWPGAEQNIGYDSYLPYYVRGQQVRCWYLAPWR